jgi:predicted transcriptional regulator
MVAVKRQKKNHGGRPTRFPNPKARTINLTDEAIEKADQLAKDLSASSGSSVSRSQAIEEAVRQYRVA